MPFFKVNILPPAWKKPTHQVIKTEATAIARFTVCFLLILTVPSCVSYKKYHREVSQNNRLRKDSAALVFLNRTFNERLAADSVKIVHLISDSVSRIFLFDTTVNKLISDANNKIDGIRKKYDETISDQSKKLNRQLSNSLNFLFAASVAKRQMEVINESYQVKIILHADSLYDKMQFTYNQYGNAILSKLNSAEFKNLIQDYSIEAKNMFVYQNDQRKADSLNTTSLVFEDFISNTKSITLKTVVDAGKLTLPEIQGNDDIILIFSKEFEPLDVDFIAERAINGTLYRTYTVTYQLNGGYMVSSNTGDVAITYPVLSDKYLLNPSDFDFFHFADATDEQVLQMLGNLKKTHPRSVIKLTGNDKQTVDCGDTKSIIIVAKGKVLKRLSRRTISCTPDTLKL